MRLKLFYWVTMLTLLISCKNSNTPPAHPEFIDSVARAHLNDVASSDSHDTTDINYKVLKAYIAKDTPFFIKLRTDMTDNNRYIKLWRDMDSCIHEPALQDLDVEEAYRFMYASAFCPYKMIVTISKKKQEINLHFIVWQYKWDTASCRVVNEFDKKLSEKNWDDFAEKMRDADFWGLKATNDVHGLDGSTLVVTGFVSANKFFNMPAKYHYVYRWVYTTLNAPFHLILKLSGNRQGCLWVK